MITHKEALIDRTTIGFAIAAVLGGVLTGWLGGTAAVERALSSAGDGLLQVALPICGGLLVAGLAQALIPPEAVSRWLGAQSGMRGLLIAEIAGSLTPGGPFGSFTMVYALGKAGADIGVLITYLTAWSTVGVMRMVVWEIPFLGIKFALLRFVICLPMGIVAGLLARRWARQWGWTTTEGIVK